LKASGGVETVKKVQEPWREYPVNERLKHAIIKGIDVFIE